MSTSKSLTKDEILHLAKLANLPLSEQEIDKYQKQLTETIQYVENLDDLDVSKVKPSSTSAQLENVFFEDGTENTRAFTPEKALQNTKHTKHQMFKVGRIMEAG